MARQTRLARVSWLLVSRTAVCRQWGQQREPTTATRLRSCSLVQVAPESADAHTSPLCVEHDCFLPSAAMATHAQCSAAETALVQDAPELCEVQMPASCATAVCTRPSAEMATETQAFGPSCRDGSSAQDAPASFDRQMLPFHITAVWTVPFADMATACHGLVGGGIGVFRSDGLASSLSEKPVTGCRVEAVPPGISWEPIWAVTRKVANQAT